MFGRSYYWGVMDKNDNVWPDAISMHRGLAIKRFNSAHTFYKSWRAAKRAGFRCAKIVISEVGT